MFSRFSWLTTGITVASVMVISLVSFAITPSGTSHAATHAHSRAAGHATAHGHSIPVRCKIRNKQKGNVVFADTQFPDTLNTTYQSGSTASVETAITLTDGLIYLDPSGQARADEATKVPTVKNGGISNGGKTYTFHLKHGLLWSNGTEVTSADYKFGWQIDTDPATGPYCLGSCDVIKTVDTPNKYTIVYHLKKVFAPFIYSIPDHQPLSWPGGWNNNAHDAAVKLEDPSWNYENTSFPTDGPFQVTRFVNNSKVVLKPMKYYDALTCGARIKSLTLQYYKHTSSMINAAASHKVNVALDYTLQNIATLKRHSGSYRLMITPAFFIEHLEFNHDAAFNGKPNPVSKTNVRLALALAVNKSYVLQKALGISASVAKPFIASTFLSNPTGFKQRYEDTGITGQWDPITRKYVAAGSSRALTDARTLLSRAGYGSGLKLNFQTTLSPGIRTKEMAAICSNWQKIKVQCQQHSTPFFTLFGGWTENGTLDHGNFQVALYGLVGNNPDPDGFRTDWASGYIDRLHTIHSSIYNNYAAIQDKTLDRTFSVGSATLNTSVRRSEYNNAQVRMNRQAHIVPLYYRPMISTCGTHILHCANSPFSWSAMWNTWQWQVR